MSCSDVAMQQPGAAACGAPRYLAAPAQKLAVYNKMQESLEVSLPSKQEEDEKDQPAEMEYLNSRCVLFTYFQGDIGAVVDEHFSRALSQASSFNSETALSKSKAGLNPLWRESSTISSQRSGFPTSFWTSSYQPPPPPCLSGVHPDFPVTAPGTFPAAAAAADPGSWPGHGLHQTAPAPAPAAAEAWPYPLASQVSPSYAHMHDVYVHRHHPHHAHVHHHHHHHHPHHHPQHREPRYGSLLVPSVRAAAARIPAAQPDGAKAEPAATGATSAWAGAFHGTVDIVPSFGFDTGLQHQDKSKETAWF
ncbi:transcription cofactor vestigial-like protein 3 isoform X2 [Melozone crissalis]|uniref:transcription cofactor vestigial-like protein 3 isoform X2 n=1 Tax=Melozone crissalis TaxID=40204 RepID=UPI0023DB0C9C|nr:transcription cofactor vestigial-like protein 3 isoform X2 [Melozone crissalis]